MWVTGALQTSLAIGTTVVLAVSLTGCGSRDQVAKTIGSGTASAPSDAPSASAPEPAAGRVLTESQIKAALLAPTDVAGKWTVKVATPSPSPSATDEVSPPECQELFKSFTLDKSRDSNAASSADVTLESGKDFDVKTVSESLATFDAVPTDAIAKIISVGDKCSKFTSTDAKGVTSTFQFFPLSLPNYGDESAAMRLQFNVSIFTGVADLVFIRIGHNIITVSNIGLGGIDTKLTPKVAAAAAAKLVKTTA